MQMRIGPACVLLVSCLLLTGCSPAIRGIVGIGLSEAGEPVALLAPCEGVVDAVRLYEMDAEGLLGDEAARWDFESGDAPDELDLLERVSPLSASDRFELRAWADHPGWINSEQKRLQPTWFDAADLARLGADEVLYGDPEDHNASIIVDRDDFDSVACPAQ